MRDDFQPLVRELTARGVRFVLIGVAGANYFAPAAGAVFTTQDRDLFLPLDPENLMRAYRGTASLRRGSAGNCPPVGQPFTADVELLRSIAVADRWLRSWSV